MSLKLSKIIGHRGACGYAPENTIESIRTAADMGVKWVEVDVKLTKDQIPIIFHDDSLERTTNGSGLVAKTDYDDIKQLEAGSWFAESFAGAKIPTLEELVEELIQHDLGLNLELKPCPGREVETAEVALDVLSQIWDDHDRLLISSFQHVCLETAHDIAGDWYRGLLLDEENFPENWKELADYLEVVTINLPDRKAEHELILDIIDYEKAVLVYTVNDPMRAQSLQRMGVDAVFTDVPDIIEENLLMVH
jgi:glycerophosphoryl diester phosphodiesterase